MSGGTPAYALLQLRANCGKLLAVDCLHQSCKWQTPDQQWQFLPIAVVAGRELQRN